MATLNHEQEREMYRLLIVGRENLQQFADRIGFLSQVKREALTDALHRYCGRALSKTDFMPFLADYVRELEERSGDAGLRPLSGDEIAQEFEKYLRRRGGEAGPSATGPAGW